MITFVFDDLCRIIQATRGVEKISKVTGGFKVALNKEWGVSVFYEE